MFALTSDLRRVYIEISKRDKVQEPLYGLPLVFLKGMDLTEVLAEKVHALIRRKKERDMYDIWYLLKRLYVPFDLELANNTVLGELPPHDEARQDILDSLKKYPSR